MLSIKKRSLPTDALLVSYSKDGHYTDCYTTVVPGKVSHVDFVTAFYTTPLFRLERAVLKWAISKPSTDAEVKQLAQGTRDQFAAWNVESRVENQILMSDFRGRTRSWLMSASGLTDEGAHTKLYFGSAVVPIHSPRSRNTSLGIMFHGLLGFHRLYSRALLYSAKLRLQGNERAAG